MKKILIIFLLFCGYINAQTLDLPQAEKIFSLPVHCIEVEYPNKLGQVLGSTDDLKSPKELRPVFYGCFDWHSSVHGYWSIIKLLKEYPQLDSSGEVRAILNRNITLENVSVESAFFKDYNNRNFERTYGWAWLFQLQSELDSWDDPDAQQWSLALKPLADTLVKKYKEYLPKLYYPIRTGQHDNTAFGLSLSIDYARSINDKEFQQLIMEHAIRLYGKDMDCNLSYEPSGSDFLSPCLEEALLMSKVLDMQEYRVWLKNFLPEIFNPDFALEPGEVSDRTDGHLVHLDGLNFSRATCLYIIAKKLPELGYLKTIADNHLNYSLGNITNDDYMGSHWLGSFALYALMSK